MAFTGKCTFSAATSALALPEIAEDVSDVVGIVSPFETPLLDALGDPHVVASNVRHEWLESGLLANCDVISDESLADTARTTGTFGVNDTSLFRVGDVVQAAGSNEVLLVVGTNPMLGQIMVTRGYGGSTAEVLTNGQRLTIVGNAALEGQDAGAARFTVRQRLSNFTQIFSAVVQVSGTEAAVRQLAVDDEMDFQIDGGLHPFLRPRRRGQTGLLRRR